MVTGIGLRQERVEVEIVELRRAAADLGSRSVRPITSSSLRKPSAARISRTSSAMKLNRLTTFSGVPVNFCAQALVLGADADRAGVGMALPHHDAAHGDQRRRADAEFLRAHHRRHHDVAAGADAAVGAQQSRDGADC